MFIPNLNSIDMNSFRLCIALENINIPLVTTIGSQSFRSCNKIKNFIAPELLTVGNTSLQDCTSLEYIDLSKCTALGTTVLNNNVFLNIIGKNITLKIPAALMTCNAGNPDGDIQYLQANNNVTIITI